MILHVYHRSALAESLYRSLYASAYITQKRQLYLKARELLKTRCLIYFKKPFHCYLQVSSWFQFVSPLKMDCVTMQCHSFLRLFQTYWHLTRQYVTWWKNRRKMELLKELIRVWKHFLLCFSIWAISSVFYTWIIFLFNLISFLFSDPFCAFP